ncbi:MAG: prenyltransferase [Phycisphaerae bacterium]|jgi:hypothetical protein|nr:prenyltransferase [Phycisphaerae bacterium]
MMRRRPGKHAPVGIPTIVLTCLLAGAVCILITSNATADKASTALDKFKEPVDKSIDRALEFLADRQLTDAQAARLRKPALAGSFNSSMRGNTGISSLCVMAFLSKGHTPGTGPYGHVINKGVDYILSTSQSNGLLVSPERSGRNGSGPMYAHCIATLLLSEVSGMVTPTRQKKIDKALPKALALILTAQRVRKNSRDAGGWRYRPDSRDSDLSLTGWAMMALRSARLNGAAVPTKSIDDAVKYVMRCRTRDWGFSYQPRSGSSSPSRVGVGLLCLELCGQQHGSEVTKRAADYIIRRYTGNRHFSGSHAAYSVYYCSQAMFQVGGKHWEQWGQRLYTTLLKIQKKDGSWILSGSRGGSSYSTAMCVLAMTVSYRQLPIYQR